MHVTGQCYCYFGPFFVTPAAWQKKNLPLLVTFADHHLPSSHFLLADPSPPPPLKQVTSYMKATLRFEDIVNEPQIVILLQNYK